jgi:hypothetical protein
VGDEAFPLKKYLLRPYPGVSARNDWNKQICNSDGQGDAALLGMLSVFSLRNLGYFVAEFNWVLKTQIKQCLCFAQLLKKWYHCGRLCVLKHRPAITVLLRQNVMTFRWKCYWRSHEYKGKVSTVLWKCWVSPLATGNNKKRRGSSEVILLINITYISWNECPCNFTAY